ncbi:MAG: hypothetical protein ACAH80_05600 [Alphaproteobacteria bacterium]
MAEPSPDNPKKSIFRNPLVWLGIVITTLAVLRLAVPEQYLTMLPAMLNAGGRCEMAREQLNNARDAAQVCAYGIKSADPVSQMFVAEVYHQNKMYGAPERDAEAKELFELAAAQLQRRAETGDKQAQETLGRLYAYSLLQNGAEAGKWFCAAAKQGSADAFTQLAFLQGGSMFATLYQGPNSYRTSGIPEKFDNECKPEKLDNSVIGGTLGFELCPYKLANRKDSCSVRKL